MTPLPFTFDIGDKTWIFKNYERVMGSTNSYKGQVTPLTFTFGLGD
jgi:hypothetical protein